MEGEALTSFGSLNNINGVIAENSCPLHR